jgi:proteasome lid subunit RPN8/RPN11
MPYGAMQFERQPLRLSEDRRTEIVEWCRTWYPNEACGLLAARQNLLVERVYTVDNAETQSPRTRYYMDPHGQLRAMRDAENDGLEVIGAFHSHTGSPAYPSEIDVELAMYPEWIWVIVSLASPALPELRAFRINHSAIEEVEILAE